MRLLRELWSKPFDEYEDKNIRLLALICGIVIHIGVVALVVLIALKSAPLPEIPPKNTLGGGSSGGGGGNDKDVQVYFGPSYGDEDTTTDTDIRPTKIHIIKIHVVSGALEGIPVIAQETKNQRLAKLKKPQGTSLAEDAPRVKRHGRGPGSGGGEGGGGGGGIGKGHGYSIDWGGSGTRRVISGRIPTYPKGTDKEMAVTLEFTVLPDGTVLKVVPLLRGDEILEHEAISALETWRFDPLPAETDQKIQNGKITFNFKLEHPVGRLQ